MRFTIAHTTSYSYKNELDYALQKLRMTPRSVNGQKIIRWNTDITNGKGELEYLDHLGNHTELVSSRTGASDLSIKIEGEVETKDNAGIIGPHEGYAPLWYFLKPTELTGHGKQAAALLKKFTKDTTPPGIPSESITYLHALSAFIGGNITYEKGTTNPATTTEEAIENGKGVCQDLTHIFISLARKLGYPARYVSGYLFMASMINQNACHAWAEVHIDGLGWVGFDVTNGISPDEHYIRVAVGRDYREAAPTTGLRLGETDEEMVVSLQVQQ